MYKKKLKSGFGNRGTYEAVWGICTALSRLKDKSMKHLYDTVNKTPSLIISVQWSNYEGINVQRHLSNLSEWPSHVDMDTNHKHLQAWLPSYLHANLNMYTDQWFAPPSRIHILICFQGHGLQLSFRIWFPDNFTSILSFITLHNNNDAASASMIYN